MGKNVKLVLLIMFLLFILLSVVYYLSRDDKNKLEKIDIAKNNLVIKNFDLSKNLTDSQGFYRVTAAIAKFDKNMGKSELDNCSIEYKTDNTTATFHAAECTYWVDKKIVLEGSVNGQINSVKINTDDNGVFNYYFDNASGIIKNGVEVHGNNIIITSEKALMSRSNRTIEFIDNVEVDYAY